VPALKARAFGRIFTERKREIFRKDIGEAEHPGRWERKGSEIFRPNTLERYGNQVRVFNGLVSRLRREVLGI
jgi:capsular polysaccharide biosynthesis protein